MEKVIEMELYLIAKANDEELSTIWEKVRLDYETSSKAVRERYLTLGRAIRARNEELRKEEVKIGNHKG